MPLTSSHNPPYHVSPPPAAEQEMDNRRVGVLGGGQLGRMMAEAGHRLGIQLAVLDPSE